MSPSRRLGPSTELNPDDLNTIIDALATQTRVRKAITTEKAG